MDLTHENLQALFKGYNTAFQQGFNSLGDDGAQYELYCTDVNSTKAAEIYTWMKSLPQLREWIGDRVVHGLEAADFTIKNRKFELTHGIDRDTVEDDSYGLYTPIYNEYGRSSREHPNVLATEALEANPICYDGQPLFDADHVVLDERGKKVSVSNDMGGTDPAWYVMDLSRALKPMIFQRRRPYHFRSMTDLNSPEVFKTDKFLFGVDARVSAGPGLWQLIVRSQQPFTAENYAAARARLKTLKGDYGRPLGLRHTHTMVPGALEQLARKVLVNTLASGGETNEWAGSSTLIENAWLAAA